MRLPFGKFKGAHVADLPDGYLGWLHGLGDLREPLRTAIAREVHARSLADDEEPIADIGNSRLPFTCAGWPTSS
jgi:Putative quorum-sensing-regulated virulence factor